MKKANILTLAATAVLLPSIAMGAQKRVDEIKEGANVTGTPSKQIAHIERQMADLLKSPDYNAMAEAKYPQDQFTPVKFAHLKGKLISENREERARQIEQFSKQLALLKQTKAKSTENQELKEVIQGYKDLIQGLSKNLEGFDKRKAQLELEISTLQSTLSQAQQALIAEKDDKKKIVKDDSEAIDRMSKKIIELTSEKSRVEIDRQALQTQLDEYQEGLRQLADLKKQYKTLQSDQSSSNGHSPLSSQVPQPHLGQVEKEQTEKEAREKAAREREAEEKAAQEKEAQAKAAALEEKKRKLLGSNIGGSNSGSK